jgi:hypothetical protein
MRVAALAGLLLAVGGGIARAGTTVIHVETEGSGDINKTSGEKNRNGAMVWNGTEWVVNSTWAHSFFVDSRTGDRLKSYPDNPVIEGNQPGTVSTPYPQFVTVERSLYTYQKNTTGGVYTFSAVQYRVRDVERDAPWIVLRSRGTGSGTANPYFDIYIRNSTGVAPLPLGPSVEAFRGDPAWFTYVMSLDDAITQTSTAAYRTGDLPGVTATAEGDYYLDIANGSDLGPAGVGRSYEFHTKPLAVADAALSLGSSFAVDFILKWMDSTGNLQILRFLPWAEGTFTPTPAAGLRFVPVTPCRISDTRLPTGALGGPLMAGNTEREFNPRQSACAIPSTAAAYSLNVTAVPHGGLGYLSLWPAGQSRPLVSTLNSVDGRIKANAAMVPAGANGAVSVYVTDASDVILDINGYFEAGAAARDLMFFKVAPCRLLDTRNQAGPLGGPILAAGKVRSFPIQNTACGNLAAAQAYSLNVTVVPTGSLGYLSLWPSDKTQPFVSTLNAPTGTVVANAAIVPASALDGSISAYVTDSSHLVIDINGYFAPPSTGSGLQFYPVTPCRMVDTRNSQGAYGGPILAGTESRTFPLLASSCTVPQTLQAYSLNATVVPPAGLSFLTLWPAGSDRPLASTLNALDAGITANAALLPAGTGGSVNAYATDKTHLVLDINGYFAP